MTEREKLEGVIGDVYVDTHELEKELKKKLDAYEVYCEGKEAFVLFERRGEEYTRPAEPTRSGFRSVPRSFRP